MSAARRQGGGSNSGGASKMRLRVWLRLLKAARMMEAELRERLRVQFDTTLPRFDVLAALFRVEKGLRMSELSGVLKVSNGNVTGIVERLVVDGFVMRVPVKDDRRAMIVRLTEKGREHFSAMAGIHEQWVSELLSCFGEEDAEQLSALLHRVTTAREEKGATAR